VLDALQTQEQKNTYTVRKMSILFLKQLVDILFYIKKYASERRK
jgi:hypothetical protein